MGSEADMFDISTLHLEGDFNQQVEQVLQNIRLTRVEVENLQKLFDDLQNTLSLAWPGCQVHAFGSIVTGLGIKSSDVDCYVHLPTWLQTPGDTYVLRAKSTLMKRPHIFKKVFAITTAKVPIVKFYHTPTRRCCDISFKSPAGVQNSKLLAYLLHLDQRVLPLTILIKYWAKVHNLTGTNLMPNYALTLLTIFYLQQKSILPPIHELQKNEYIIDNWNVAFEDSIHLSGDDNEPLYQLLGGFFKYYRDFRYDQFIISPFLGQPVEREWFCNVENVPPQYKVYKVNVKRHICQPIRLNSAICIQDPFEHNRNCSIAMYPNLVKKVMTYFKLSAEVFHNVNSDTFIWGILSLDVKDISVINKGQRKGNCRRGIKKRKHECNTKRNSNLFHKRIII